MAKRCVAAALATWLATLAGLVGAPVGAQPATSPESITNWTPVDAGTSHTCGVTLDGRAFCWGSDGLGALGNGPGGTGTATPSQVAGGSTKWAAVSAGELVTCALKTTGRLYCWGKDATGQLGDGNGRQNRSAPVEVAGGRTDWTSVSVGTVSTCAIRAGRLYCWGVDTFGALGNGGTDVSRNAPVEVAGGATNWASVSVGAFGACARKTTGRVLCWGDDGQLQIGDGSARTGPARRPTEVASGGTAWMSVDAGPGHRCGIRTNRRLFCWGDDDNAQLGAPGQDVADRDVPTEVVGAVTDWDAVAGVTTFTCALKVDDAIWCWGRRELGQMGTGSTSDFIQFGPAPGATTFTDWQSVTAGDSHACAIRVGGALYCWGRGEEGQLGTGPLSGNPIRTSPTQVAP